MSLQISTENKSEYMVFTHFRSFQGRGYIMFTA